MAITFAYSKARRPDLKQLLYILTVTDDGGFKRWLNLCSHAPMASARDKAKRWQFSLRMALFVVALLSLWLAVQFAVPAAIRLFTELALPVACSAAITATIVYGRGNIRAFAIGALFPPASAMIGMTVIASSYWLSWPELITSMELADESFARASMAWIPLSIILGVVTVAVRCVLRGLE